jgi:hypothetical protein
VTAATYNRKTFAAHGVGAMTESEDVQVTLKRGMRSKEARRAGRHLLLQVRRTAARNGVELDRSAIERLELLLIGVAYAASEEPNEQRRGESPSPLGATRENSSTEAKIRRLSADVVADLRASGVLRPTTQELESAIFDRCKFSLPPFCHKR